MVGTIGKQNKMAAILSTIGKQKRPLPFKFQMCSVFQPSVYLINFRKAGRGIWNVSKSTTIPVGTFFGPYRGARLNPNDYVQAKESGYAWELLDSSHKKRVIGYVDPGPDPDPETNWLAIVNSANIKSKLLTDRKSNSCNITVCHC